jgi:hypothetical protein
MKSNNNNLYFERCSWFVIQNDLYRDQSEIIKVEVSDVKLSFVDSPIMNQSSYEVSSQRFTDCGFKCSGDIHRGIASTISLLRTAHNV